MSLIESILTFNIGCWYGSLSYIDWKKLTQIVRLAGKIIGKEQASLETLYKKSVVRKATSIAALSSLFLSLKSYHTGKDTECLCVTKNIKEPLYHLQSTF